LGSCSPYVARGKAGLERVTVYGCAEVWEGMGVLAALFGDIGCCRYGLSGLFSGARGPICCYEK
jgi:hypothetical protein